MGKEKFLHGRSSPLNRAEAARQAGGSRHHDP
jgi:hypothetical protein